MLVGHAIAAFFSLEQSFPHICQAQQLFQSSFRVILCARRPYYFISDWHCSSPAIPFSPPFQSPFTPPARDLDNPVGQLTITFAPRPISCCSRTQIQAIYRTSYPRPQHTRTAEELGSTSCQDLSNLLPFDHTKRPGVNCQSRPPFFNTPGFHQLEVSGTSGNRLPSIRHSTSTN